VAPFSHLDHSHEHTDQALPYQWFVGIDWGSQSHQVCVLDRDRRPIGERSVAHEGGALAACATWLTTLAAGEVHRVAVAIEIPRGAIVELLVERGFHVFAINPKQLDRFRDRHTVAGAKDDRRDAFVLADSLRTDRPSFRQVQVEGPDLLMLRELSRTEEALLTAFRRATNQLREQLHRFYAPLLQLCPAADEPWLWDLLDNWLRVLGPAELAQIDQRVCQQLHPIVPPLDTFKSEQQPLALVFPCKGPFDTHA
jgi:hypothetical protein